MRQRLDQQVASPDGMRALGSVYQYVVKSGLSPELIDLVFLRASQINGCVYCIAAHSGDLLKRHVAAEKLLLLSAWRETDGLFTEKECAALQWAESITLVSATGAPDKDYQAVAAQFDEKQLADLTIAIGLINAYNRLGVGFRRPAEVAVAAA